MFADFGISNGLINLVASALGKDDRIAAKRAISSAFWFLLLISGVLFIVWNFVYPFLNLSAFFNLKTPLAITEAGPALAALLMCFLLNLPLGAVSGTQYGMQEGAKNNLWSLGGSILSFVFLLIAMDRHAGLPVLVWALSGPPVLALLLNGIFLFARQNRDLAPSLFSLDIAASKLLLKTGGMLFIIQLAMSVGMQTDNIVIARIMGPAAVAQYAVPAKLFNIVNSVLVLLSGPIWPAYVDALARNDAGWIFRTFRRVSIFGGITAILIAGIFVLFGRQIIPLWVGVDLHVSLVLLLIFGIQCVVYAYLQPIGFLLNGLARYRVQASCAAGMAILNLGLSILFVKRFGVVGAVMGTIVAQLVFQVIPLTMATKSAFTRLRKGRLNLAGQTE